MKSNIKHSSLGWAVGILLGLVCAGAFVYAGGLSTYNPGDTLKAADMNAIVGSINGTGGCAGNPAVPGDTMVRVGATCVDKYEASINAGVAASVANVAPATGVTWFQAADACAKAGKRLLTNAEWQTAAAGSPAGVTSGAGCNGSGTVANTGAFSAACVSSYGVVDMPGNASEWVADTVPKITTDVSNAVGVLRGGDATDGTVANANYMFSGTSPINTTLGATDSNRGFRCGR